MVAPEMRWHAGATYTQPLWIASPDIATIEAISRNHLIPYADRSVWELTASFLTEGAFNKIYTVDIKSPSLVKSYIFRVSLPVEPLDKIRNEVAILDYIKRHTTIPVPTVFAHDSSSDNELGFEWILMEKVPGKPLRDIWSSLSDNSKVVITREIANYILQMRKNCVFDKIGGLYRDVNGEFTIGSIVTQFMFMGSRRQLLSRNRGPYHHDSEFVRALIDMQIADIHLLQTMEAEDPNFDEDLLEDGPRIIQVMKDMLSLVPVIFPRDELNEPLRTILHHPDLSLNNIMIDSDTLQITGIIDWECTNASPSWKDTYPQFLTGPEVEKEASRVEPGDTDELRNELWDNWEKMQLRAAFDEVAGCLEEEPLASLKREFVDNVGAVEYSQVIVEQWVENTWSKLRVPALGVMPLSLSQV